MQRELNLVCERLKVVQFEKEELFEKNKVLKNENNDLKKEVQKLKPLVEKLTLSSNKLELILKDQKESNNKFGIGYKGSISNKFSTFTSYAPKFISSKQVRPKFASSHGYYSNSKIVCYAGNNIGHKAFECHLKHNDKKKIKKVWVPKGTISTNLQGPKKAWVPKFIK